MTFVVLCVAIAVEVAATSMLRTTAGFTRPLPTVAVLVAYASSFGLVAKVIQHMPVGVVYVLWSGIGSAAIALIGVVAFHEPISPAMGVGLVLVVLGVVALNLA